ncbi:MAG TPA: M23 family metallopeptidase [Clostridiaceae bacterium]|nr:M23 family metallopeptidase [Clostridiaceae bacterium]
MEKAKTKKEKEYLSILLVPHSTGNVKEYRLTAFYTKLVITLIVMLASLACMAFYIVSTVKENTRLKNSIYELSAINSRQLELLNNKASEIQNLRNKEETINAIIREYAEKHREITENYISGLISGNASRSGNRSVSSFSADIKELNEILKSLNEINSSEDNLVDLTEAEKMLQEYLDSIPTLWPVSGRISDKFGYRTDPFTRRKTFHEGLDIAASTGTDIKAAARGKVIFAGKKSGYGNVVILEHENQIKTVYAHASKLLVKEGQEVKKGEIIAKVGSTGRSTGPHLHFEVLVSGTPVDPLNFLE